MSLTGDRDVCCRVTGDVCENDRSGIKVSPDVNRVVSFSERNDEDRSDTSLLANASVVILPPVQLASDACQIIRVLWLLHDSTISLPPATIIGLRKNKLWDSTQELREFESCVRGQPV